MRAPLAAAFLAVVFEEGTSPALREPGLPPIFLAVWAMLWALVRTERSASASVHTDRPSSAPAQARRRGVRAANGTNHCNFNVKQYIAVADLLASASATGKDLAGGALYTTVRKMGGTTRDVKFAPALPKFYAAD